MNASTIKKTSKLAQRIARRRGYAHLAEDFSQEVLLIHVERPNRKATLNQYFIDFLRKTYGTSRVSKCFDGKMKLAFAIPIDGMDMVDTRHESDEDEIPRHQSYRHLFNSRNQKIYDLYFIEGLTKTEVAKRIGLSLSWISRIINDEMKPKILEHRISNQDEV